MTDSGAPRARMSLKGEKVTVTGELPSVGGIGKAGPADGDGGAKIISERFFL
jgi:hypothetical protein